MKTKTILYLLAITLLAGCGVGKSDKSLPIENGFYYGGHSEGFPDRTSWAGLQYQDPTGKRTDVWGYLTLANPCVQITNNLAVMVGGVYDDGMKRFSARLIAFEAPTGPPMDITEQLLQKYCAESGVKRTNVIQDSFVSLTKTNDALRIDFVILRRGLKSPDSIDDGDGIEIIPWHDIEAIMQDVKKTGKLKKEKWSGVEYLQKD